MTLLSRRRDTIERACAEAGVPDLRLTHVATEAGVPQEDSETAFFFFLGFTEGLGNVIVDAAETDAEAFRELTAWFGRKALAAELPGPALWQTKEA